MAAWPSACWGRRSSSTTPTATARGRTAAVRPGVRRSTPGLTAAVRRKLLRQPQMRSNQPMVATGDGCHGRWFCDNRGSLATPTRRPLVRILSRPLALLLALTVSLTAGAYPAAGPAQPDDAP